MTDSEGKYARLTTLADVAQYRERVRQEYDPQRPRVRVCMTGCRAFGAVQVRDALAREIEEQGLAREVDLVETGCHGLCAGAPVLAVDPYGFFYQHVRPEDAADIVGTTLKSGAPLERLGYDVNGTRVTDREQVPFFRGQRFTVLRNCGQIDPTRVEDYIRRDGYAALARALAELSPEDVIAQVKASGLRGRGGAGFPTGRKWELARSSPGDKKYLICNADEGDPGAFMDRGVLEGDPHSVLEGMAIAAYAIGADEGYIYVRAEYPIAVRHLRIAIAQAEAMGLLGSSILGTDFSFTVRLKEGAGAFVCGEETALMASIEGRRGMPNPRPPFPAQSGLWGKPTNINNVETFANIAPIVLRGGEWYASVGTEGSKGTKVFSLAGKVANTGLVEVPMGITPRQVIYDIGGGIHRGRAFKAAQMGGPSGGCVPAQHLDLPIDYESLTSIGSMMGSGGMIIMDEATCIVDLARFFLNFVQSESCGKCVPCRVGTRRMLEILTRITQGEGREEDLETLESMGRVIKDSSLCGLGQTAPNPVLSTLRYFRDEYLAHIRDRRCPAGVCSRLSTTPCQDTCPAGVDAYGYVSLIAEGRLREAMQVVRERIPLPSVCGRICYHPCEARCRRGDVDQSVGIGALKRFLADHEYAVGEDEPIPLPAERPAEVAIIGAGPAGLSAAYHLARKGYRSTIFEALPTPGGMLVAAIPAYRLPRDVLEREIDYIRRMGVEIRTGVRVGTDITLDELRAQGYRAFFIATGAHASRRMGVPGEDLPGVVGGLEFLRAVNLGPPPKLWGRVIVIGGGNVAMDAARSALRLGADEVSVVYRRSRAEMPAHEWEIREAEYEGVQFCYLTAPVKVVEDSGRAVGVLCQRMELGPADERGRRRPMPVAGSEHLHSASLIIAAVGQETDSEFLASLGLGTAEDGTVVTDPHTTVVVGAQQAAPLPGMFAGGDVVNGPATAVHAMGDGRRAAESIRRYLEGLALAAPSPPARSLVAVGPPPEEMEGARSRAEMPQRPVQQRVGSFDEVDLGLSLEQALEEARRCLRCGREEPE
jgi:NADH-quinone oxidoreductase subunit F